jgi:hypothetical protein
MAISDTIITSLRGRGFLGSFIGFLRAKRLGKLAGDRIPQAKLPGELPV